MVHPLAEFLNRPDPKNPKKKITQQQFAALVGSTQSTISKFLRGDLQKLDDELAERVVEVTKGRVSLLDCIYRTPHRLKAVRQ